MSTLDEKLARSEQRGGKARATEEQIRRLWGQLYVAETDSKGRVLVFRRSPPQHGDNFGPVEIWKRVDSQWFERE